MKTSLDQALGWRDNTLLALWSFVFVVLTALTSPRIAAGLVVFAAFLGFWRHLFGRRLSKWWMVVAFFAVTTAVVVWMSPYVRGASRLRNIVSGISTPASDFSWATNGSVTVNPIDESDMSVLAVEMVLRGGPSVADCGWGMDLMRWNWLSLSRTRYESGLATRQGISFYIRGANGRERVGVSLKSDRLPPDPAASSSDEERLSLEALGYTPTTTWQEVRVPFARFTSFEKHRPRNFAVYSDSSLQPVPQAQTIYIRDISFW